MFCKNCGNPITENMKFCKNCGQALRTGNQQISPGKYPAQQKNSTRPNKKLYGVLIPLGAIIIIIIIIIIAIIALLSDSNKSSSNILFGNKQTGTAVEIETTGGNIAVSDANSPINGLEIDVPANAYEKQTSFTLSTTVIKSHHFGKDFTPVTPLITIDNGHVFSQELMTVSIPIAIGEEDFAMAFYYDQTSGQLEGIPLTSLSGNQIVIKTSHFSDIVVSKIKKSELTGLLIDTEYQPGLDDWQFENNGSSIEPNGHCAGQSISSMWYFYEKYKKSGEKRLFGRFDNNGKGMKTKDLDMDDSWSYRYASVIQRKIDWDSNSRKIFLGLRGNSDSLTYYSFAYSMLLTKSPQYAGISYYEKNGDLGGGHAVVAYKIENNIICIADPNYPGITTRQIAYNIANNKFEPYESGRDAAEIKKGNSHAYTDIGYFAVSSMIDWSVVGDEYEKMIHGQSGTGLFPPDVTMQITGFDNQGNFTISDLTDGYTLTASELKKINPFNVGKIYLAPKVSSSKAKFEVYMGATLVWTGTGVGMDEGKLLETVLKPGNNDVGIYYSILCDNGEYKYVNFYRFNIRYTDKEESTVSDTNSAAVTGMQPTPTSVPTTAPTPTPTPSVKKEYDYQAALALWTADFTAEINKRTYDDGVYKGTERLEWVLKPFIRDGMVLGAHKIWTIENYYTGELAGTTKTYVVNTAFSAEEPGLYMYIGELRSLYPQFEPK